MITATLANAGFLPHKPAAYLDGANLGEAPTLVQWQVADPQSARFVTEEYIGDARGKGQVAWLLEPFFLHPAPYLTAMEKGFDYVLTHDQNFVTNDERWLWYPAGGSWIAPQDWDIHEKTKDVSILLSSKKSTRGHRLRHEVIERYGDKVDVFGLDHRVTPLEALADYRYSIIIENEKSRYWFTEKLIDCLSVGTIPIYWGCPDIENFFDASGIIEFDGTADLSNILDWLRHPNVAEGDSNSRADAIKRNLETARKYRCCEDWIVKQYPFLFDA